jgi:MGT family glycosyltransferase
MHLVIVGATAPSHTYPSLALVRELVARGHRVDYVIGGRLQALVAPTGARVIAHPTLLPDTDAAWSGDPGAAMQLFLDEQIAVLPRVLALERPDAVLYDIGGYAGHVAAHRWGVPAIQLSPASVAWEGYEDDMAEFYDALRASPTGARYFATARAWLDEHGVALSADEFLGRPAACVAVIPRVLQPHADRVDARYVFAGPCVDEERIGDPGRWAAPAGETRPLVLLALGTAYTDREDLYRAAIDGLAGQFRLVLATGKVDPARLGPLPDGVQAARTQPQLDVLHHADVFVTHAGMGSAAESLWFGVPTVAIPQAVDQFMNAEQLEATGAGVRLADEDVTPEGLRRAVRGALARGRRARELQSEVRRAGGAGRAADAVEAFAVEGRSR